MRQDCFPRVKKTTYNWVKLICIVCVCVCTSSWSTLKNAIWQGLLSRLAKVMKASASSRLRMRTAAMNDMPWTWNNTNTNTNTDQHRRHTDWTSVLWGYFLVLLDRSLTLILTNDCVIRFQASFYIFIIISLSCIVTNTILWHKVTNHWLHFWHLIMISVI